MAQKILTKEEVVFWYGLNLEMGKELELGVPSLDIQLEDVGQWVPWGLE